MDKYFTTDAYYKIEIQRTRAFSIYMGLVPPPSIFAQYLGHYYTMTFLRCLFILF